MLYWRNNMTSTYWYTALALFCMAISAFVVYTNRHVIKISTFAAYYIFTASITWIGEFIVLGIFDSYAYKPGISTDIWAENLAGHLFLNASMFPAAAILSVAYPVGFLGAAVITAAFILAEYLFARLGIYEQHWWKYYMSVINTLLFLAIAKSWFAKIKHAHRDIPRLLTFYFIGFLIIHTPAPFLLLLGKQHYSLELIDKLVDNMYRSSIIFIFSYHLIEAAVFLLFISILDKWYWKLVPYAITAAVQTIFLKMNILILTEGWKLVYTILCYHICISIFILIEKYSLTPEN